MNVVAALARCAVRIHRGQRPQLSDLDCLIANVVATERTAPTALLYRWVRDRSRSRRLPWLQQLQARKLRQTVDYALEHVPYYRRSLARAGVGPGDVRGLEDLRHLPLTSKADLQADASHFLSQHPSCVFTTQLSTSGTTGKPIVMWLTRDEVAYYAAMQALYLKLAGQLDATDVVQVHLSMDISTEVLLLENAARKLGAGLIRFGTHGCPEEHLASLLARSGIPGKKPGVSVLLATPSHLMALLRLAREQGVDLRDCHVERVFTGGAKVSAALRQRLTETWGVDTKEIYASAEMTPLSAMQCPETRALHFNDVMGLLEVLDPATGQPVADGEVGVATVTTFYPDREGMPLVRYRTGDLVRAVSGELCCCGSPTSRITEVVGREDGMVWVGGRNFFLQEVGQALAEALELATPPRFSLYATEQVDVGQQIVLDVELAHAPAAGPERDALQARVREHVFTERYWQAGQGIVHCSVNLVARLEDAAARDEGG